MLNSSLRHPNFCWLWIGQTFIYCASQFWFVALTWLVLQKTGSGIALGTVLMAAAIPRGILMLVGGAISDRFPPNTIAALATVANTLLSGSLTLLLATNTFHLHGIILISGLFGISEAFLYPATLALLPRIIRNSRLAQANAWMQGSEQISNVLGPALAGIVIGILGLTPAFALNATLFTIGAGCIYLVRIRQPIITVSLKPHTLTQEIWEGVRYAGQHPGIRISLLLIAMINFAILGPVVVGVAELVTLRLCGDATTFGYLQSAYGVGALVGVWIASQLGAIKQLQTPLVFLAIFLGTGLIALGFVSQTWTAGTIILLMGVGGGIVGVLALTWLQQETAIAMQGRMMSLVMFAAVALDPFSQAISGVLLDISLTGLFLAAGATMLITALVALLNRTGDCSP
ncbi:MFS transporter (plasmid) [Synechocystis sp. PCC 7339]|uniref:MFS transporter n=1 Tax=unclassified Synechocystis TaxID=2640012 RepID=UPI001BAE8156|nr:MULTISPECIES: MFS transporter [unclassified Synechocystis]QUS62599.1 MFS transporter [Synechocystis sp. PCC 7338]UAJ74591.1 MFS transporter [Synechocystis sp. PCC 7339]